MRYFALITVLLICWRPAGAHHSTAPYDLTRPCAVHGVVTRFEWMNPHSHIYLDAPTEEGEVEHWTVEIDGPNGLLRQGWKKDSLKSGDKVTCFGARARDGGNSMRCTLIEFDDGRQLHSN